MYRFDVYLGILIAVLFCIGFALAADSYAANASPCAGDVEKFCKDVKPGGGAIAACLSQHQNDLSPACKEHVAAMQQRRELIRDINRECKQDAAKFCQDVRPGQGRIVRCLTAHENELSAPCGEKIKALQNVK